MAFWEDPSQSEQFQAQQLVLTVRDVTVCD